MLNLKCMLILAFASMVIWQLKGQEDLIETYVGCEKERVAFKCIDKMAPDIISAIWGVQEGASCPIPDNDDMTCSADVVNEVRDKCQLKKCAFSPNKRQLGDPCSESGTPIVKIVYQCRPIPTTTLEPPETTTTTTTTTTSTTTTTTTTPAPPADGTIRLADGETADEGIAQIYRNGQWGNICDIKFSNEKWPTVFCLELGYESALNSDYLIERDPSYTGAGYPINYESPKCTPEEGKKNYAATMAECGSDDEPTCGHELDVYIKCGTQDPGTEGQIRLYGSGDEGLAQIYRNGNWGNMCDVKFNYEKWPTVFCQELGYSTCENAVYAVDLDPAYTSSFPITFESPKCNTDQSTNNYAETMATCNQDDEPDCGHDKDVYIYCA